MGIRDYMPKICQDRVNIWLYIPKYHYFLDSHLVSAGNPLMTRPLKFDCSKNKPLFFLAGAQPPMNCSFACHLVGKMAICILCSFAHH